MDGVVTGLKIGGKILASGAAAGLIVASAGTAAPIVAPLAGAAITCVGKGIKEAAKDSDNEFLQFVGETVVDTGLGAITGGVLTASNGLFSQVANQSLRTAKRTGEVGEALVGITAKTGQYASEIATHEVSSYCYEGYLHTKHRGHQARGIEHDPDCLICNDWL